MEMGSDRQESGLDAVIREAAEKNHQQQEKPQDNELDTIAQYRGQAQEQMNNMLLGHLHGGKGHGGNKPDEAKISSDESASGSAGEELQKCSEEAKKQVFRDPTYDAIEEAKKTVAQKLGKDLK